MKCHNFTNILIFILLFCSGNIVQCTEIKYTPNENDSSGPLPLSQNQRNQLLQLEQAISQSPDPQATLEQVAQSNNMSPQDLLQMLQQNRQDLQQGGGGGVPTTLLKDKVFKLMSALAVVISQAAKKNPKLFTIAATSILLFFYMSFMIPRNGFIISKHAGLFSKGHTTMCSPPTKYLNQLLNHPKFMPQKMPSIKEDKLELDDGTIQLLRKKDGVHSTSRFGRRSKLASAIAAQSTLYLEDFLPENDIEDNEFEDDQDLREMVSNVLFDQVATTILLNHRFTEFTEDTLIRFQQSSADRSAILVIPKSGDYGRFGLQPLRMIKHSMGDNSICIKYITLRGGVLDGQLHFLAKKARSGDLSIQVHLLVPKKARRKWRRKKLELANEMVSTLVSSLSRSIKTEARQRLARQGQGKKFGKRAKDMAVKKRRERHEREQKLEEMAEDRRRRWQRSNPSAGSYRPSGDRMRSPNNC